MSSNTLPKLHNAMWPGLVGKGDEPGQEPPISLERMLELTAAAEVNGQKFDGIDYFLFGYINNYVFYKMNWNTQTDVAALMAEHHEKLFGPAISAATSV